MYLSFYATIYNCKIEGNFTIFCCFFGLSELCWSWKKIFNPEDFFLFISSNFSGILGLELRLELRCDNFFPTFLEPFLALVTLVGSSGVGMGFRNFVGFAHID